MKRCSWCDQPIEGEAMPLGDDAASGAHPAGFWHADQAACGPRRQQLPGPDSTTVTPVTVAMWDWRESESRP